MVTMFYERHLNKEFDGFGQKNFDSADLAMAWVREQSNGTSSSVTIENVRIYESAKVIAL
jgi:hypothetical protein